MYKITTDSPSRTEHLAQIMARGLEGGEIIFLRGPIGAGKTIFVKALAKSLGLKGSPVSASFSIMKEYKGKGKRLFHVDLFRLEENEMFNLGFEEMLEAEDAIIVAEWPDPIANLINSPRIEMNFVLQEGDNRIIELTAKGAGAKTQLDNFIKQVENER
ncbi:tRNA threonylcarbamoyladenosine biosynthesis protein TsaE [Elusimicrobium simillimum]|uniref:tRNA (adenosine(37)-N6)-threonylcarbamoyltransferase complex ATPase subunit type 1 TsaE n=1 Tax=Elusimicrobium simillimum TaxID=3143438 RepID=UPI003C6F9E00